MLSPLIVGFLFFAVSAFSAFRTINNSSLPENFEDISLKIKDYQIQQIDEKTNTVKWVLRADRAETSSDESQAKVTKPQIVFFDNAVKKFTIDGDFADLDKANQKIEIRDNVVLETANSSIKILSNKMFFAEENPFVEFYDHWKLENNQGYIIDGKRGKLSKARDLIVSEGDAVLEKPEDNFKISADKITLKLNDAVPVVAEKNSVLYIGFNKKLYAQDIKIKANGEVDAHGQVKVETAEIECYADNMHIEAKANKKPKLASFTGNPYVIQDGSKLYADKILFDFDTSQAQLLGSVHSE